MSGKYGLRQTASRKRRAEQSKDNEDDGEFDDDKRLVAISVAQFFFKLSILIFAYIPFNLKLESFYFAHFFQLPQWL